MRLILTFFILSFLCTVTCKAQTETKKNPATDTVSEKEIIEYDTIYLAPDTTKLIDTIVHYLDLKNQKKIHKKSWSFKPDFNNILTPFKKLYNSAKKTTNEDLSTGKQKVHKWSILFAAEPYVNGFLTNGKINDSLAFKKVVNAACNLGIMYHRTRYFYTFGLGYTSLFEQIQYQSKHYSSNISQYGNSSYDSILVTNSSAINNNFKLLNIFISAGYNWPYTRINLSFSFTFGSDILIDYSAIALSNSFNNKIEKSTYLKDVNFSIGIKPYISYNISKRWKFFVAPFYSHTLNNSIKYPLTNFSKTGLDVGLMFIL